MLKLVFQISYALLHCLSENVVSQFSITYLMSSGPRALLLIVSQPGVLQKPFCSYSL